MDANSSSRHPELVSGSITSAAPGQRRKAQLTSQVPPSWVAFFDQIDLPSPAPILDLLLTKDRLVHGAEHLEMDEHVDVVSLGKALKRAVPMLSNSRHQVGRHTGIDRPTITAGHKVGARLEDALHSAQCALRWTLKQVQGDDKAVV